MIIQEPGVRADSERFLFTPSSFAEQVLFYPTRMGHFYCDTNYRFNNECEIAMQPGHRFHYMMFLVRKDGMLLRLDGRDYEAQEGDIVLFDCRQPHAYRASTDHMEFYWLVFDGISSDTLYDRILEMHGDHNVFPAAAPGDLEMLLRRLIALASSREYVPETAVSELIYSVICCMLPSPAKNRHEKSGLIGDGMDYMDRHFAEPLSVGEVAAHVGLSASYFTKCFRLQTGFSPHEYLTIRRIGRAKDLLLSTRNPVREIAYETGYASEENFIRAFQKLVGVTPAAYRRFPV